MVGSRRSVSVWIVVAAAAVLAIGGYELANSSTFRLPALRSEHAQRGKEIPPDMPVLVAEHGKTFHAAGCQFIHDKANLRTVPAGEAEQEGYAPCVRCLKKYVDAGGSAQADGGSR